jgi:tetratricopeptide (TPR) repeat protein
VRAVTGGNGSPRRACNHRSLALAQLAILLLPVLLPALAAAQDKPATLPATFEDAAAQASAARDANDAPRAIELYGQALQLNPKWQDGWWFLGSLQYGADQYQAARDALTHYLDLAPKAGPAFALRGLCEFETSDYAQSLADIQRALSLGAANGPRNEQILRYHEALLLTRNQRFEDALRAYAVFARDRVTNPELLIAIGLAGLRTPLLPKDVAADQQDLYTAAGNAAFQFMAGDTKQAQPAFQDLFQRFPTAPNAHYLYGYLLFATDPDQALPEFKRELEIAPSNSAAQVMMAWDSLMRSDFAEALPYAEKAAAAEPEAPVAQLVLGRSLLETGDVKGGMEHLEKALQLDPNNLETHLALVKAYSKSGRKDDARRERLLCLQLAKSQNAQVAQP